MTITPDLISRALRGDAWALEQFPPGRRAALARTAERLRALPEQVAWRIAEATSEDECEAIMAEAMTAALAELDPRPSDHN